MGDRSESYLEGKAGLAKLAIKNLRQTINTPRVSTKLIQTAMKPILALDWDKPLVRIIGTKTLLELFRDLRSTGITSEEYRELVNKIKKYLREEEMQIPDHWDLWTLCSKKYRLEEALGWSKIMKMVTTFAREGTFTPWDLSLWPKDRVELVSISDPTFEKVDLLWQAARCWTEGQNLELARKKPNMKGQVTTLVKAIKAPTIQETQLAISTNKKREALDLPENFDSLTPMARTMALKQCSAPDYLIDEFCDLRAQENILRAVQGSLRSVASGINCYLRFCDTREIPAFPITVATVRRWSGIFHPGKTFGLYASHLKKADMLLGNEPSWHNCQIHTISKGLINAQDRSFAFTNFIQSNDLFRILEHENNSALARIAYISYLFSLRVPSETLQLIRAPATAPLLKFIPQVPKVLIGVQTFEQIEVLVIKFKYRKNIRGGCILLRPCLCNEPKMAARALCPVHFWWKKICESTRVGDPLFPKTYANSVNQQIKAVMDKLGYEQGRKYSSHAFRRGATEEIKDSGSTFATIIKSGTWTAAGFKSYLDLQRDEALNISRLLLENADSNSEDDDPPPDKDRDLRSRLKTIPMVLKMKESQNLRKRKLSPISPSDNESEMSVDETSSMEETSEGTN